MKRFALSALLIVPLACGGRAKKNTQIAEPAPLSEQTYTHYLRGQVAFFQGDYQRARLELTRAKREAPGQAPISRALASAHYQAGDRRAAQAEMQWALQQWPNDAQIWLQSATLHRSARAFAQASKAYANAIELGARDEDVYLGYGAMLAELGHDKQAASVFRKLITKDASSSEAHYQLALLLREGGDLAGAARHAGEATTRNTYDLRAWALQASALRAMGRTEEAADALRRPFDRSRGDRGVGEQLFTELLDLGERAQALTVVGILDRDDLPVDTRIAMGHWLLRAGDFAGALHVAGRLDSAIASSAAIAELRARALRALHRDADAQQQLEAIGPGQPGYPLMQSLLAQLLADTGHADQAETLLGDALERFPDHPDLIMASAAVAEASGQIDRAREILKAALARHPEAERALFALAEIEARSGNSDQAIATITPLLDANPQRFDALNYIGYSLIDDPDSRPRARDLLLRALEMAPDSAFVLDSYAWFLLRTGQTALAEPLLERAVRLTPTEPELLAHLAELRWLQGRPDEAAKLLAQADLLALARHSKDSIERVRIRLSEQMRSSQP